MTQPGNSPELDALALRLNRPAGNLQAFAALSIEQRAELIRAVDQSLSARQQALERALRRLLPWPLSVVLRWLRR
ncbi:MAG: hypothetical protein ACT4PG_09745 [Panacagrimonas sp.]